MYPAYCECILSASVALPSTDRNVIRIATATVQYINSALAVYGATCSSLRLARGTEARITNNTSAMTSSVFFTLTFQTQPGAGLFQAVVEPLAGSDIAVRGDILRINKYGGQAGCIQHVVHQKWCCCHCQQGKQDRTVSTTL